MPDKYLVDQVVTEAGRLGIAVVTDPKAFAYSQGKAVLVDTFQTLFKLMSADPVVAHVFTTQMRAGEMIRRCEEILC